MEMNVYFWSQEEAATHAGVIETPSISAQFNGHVAGDLW